MTSPPFEVLDVPRADLSDQLDVLRDCPGIVPVIVGGKDRFGPEWEESVDVHVDPTGAMANADAEGFPARAGGLLEEMRAFEKRLDRFSFGFNTVFFLVALPFRLLFLPISLLRWAVHGERPELFSNPWRDPMEEVDDPGDANEEIDEAIAEYEALLAKMDAGERSCSSHEYRHLKRTIDNFKALKKDLGAPDRATDPLAYTIGDADVVEVALIPAVEPWQAIGWLQHGIYLQGGRMVDFLSLFKLLHERYGARIFTATNDALGIRFPRPIKDAAEAGEVIGHFKALEASEICGAWKVDQGDRVVGLSDWWVWWD